MDINVSTSPTYSMTLFFLWKLNDATLEAPAVTSSSSHSPPTRTRTPRATVFFVAELSIVASRYSPLILDSRKLDYVS